MMCRNEDLKKWGVRIICLADITLDKMAPLASENKEAGANVLLEVSDDVGVSYGLDFSSQSGDIMWSQYPKVWK